MFHVLLPGLSFVFGVAGADVGAISTEVFSAKDFTNIEVVRTEVTDANSGDTLVLFSSAQSQRMMHAYGSAGQSWLIEPRCGRDHDLWI